MPYEIIFGIILGAAFSVAVVVGLVMLYLAGRL